MTAESPEVVEMRVPARPVYVSLLRTATASLAARVDFTLDEIDDLRIAIDEASALLLADVVDGGELLCRFNLGEAELAITVSAPTANASAPNPSSFAWTVLTALAGDVSVEKGDDGMVTIGLHKTRSARL